MERACYEGSFSVTYRFISINCQWLSKGIDTISDIPYGCARYRIYRGEHSACDGRHAPQRQTSNLEFYCSSRRGAVTLS
jgi:hypothetical protein